MNSKDDLRSERLEARRALTLEQVRDFSHAITERVERLGVWRDAPAILTYVASKDNEVDTRLLIQHVLDEERVLLVPIAEKDGALRWSRLLSFNELAPARFGILEPKPEARRITVPPPHALVIVPGIAFTPDGFRIGYGGGYYDRFLADHPGPTIGLAFECQLISDFPRDEHDQPVQHLITERRILY